MNRNNIKLGALYMLISVTGFSIMDIAVKWTTAEYSIGMVIAARMIGGLIPPVSYTHLTLPTKA